MARPRAPGASVRRTFRPPGSPRSLPVLVTRPGHRVIPCAPRARTSSWPSDEGPGPGPKYAVFRVYLRWPNQRVSDKTVTRSRYLAWFEYRPVRARGPDRPARRRGHHGQRQAARLSPLRRPESRRPVAKGAVTS